MKVLRLLFLLLVSLAAGTASSAFAQNTLNGLDPYYDSNGLPLKAASEILGGTILITSDKGGDYGLYTMRLDGSTIAKLNSNKSGDSFARWSPDGTKIAFVKDDGKIWMMNADGTKKKSIITGSSADFSPDGKKLVYSAFSNFWGGNNLYTYNLSTHKIKNVTDIVASESEPDWNRSNKIVYTHSFYFYGVYYKNIHIVDSRNYGDSALN